MIIEQGHGKDVRPALPPMVGRPRQQTFAFYAAPFIETSSDWFALILCPTPFCDLKHDNNGIFKIGATMMKT